MSLENDNPVYNAEVYVEKLSIGSTTNASGYFSIELPHDSDYILSVSHVGYNSKNIDLSDFKKKEIIKININKKVLNVDNVVVTALGRREYALNADMVVKALRARRMRPILLVDVSVPGDVDPAVNRVDAVFLYELSFNTE